MTFTATPSPYRFVPALVGGAFGVLLAFILLVAPVWRLEMLVAQLGLADILSAAQPPLGVKARLLLAFGIGAGGGAVLWAATVENRISGPNASRTDRQASSMRASSWAPKLKVTVSRRRVPSAA